VAGGFFRVRYYNSGLSYKQRMAAARYTLFHFCLLHLNLGQQITHSLVAHAGLIRAAQQLTDEQVGQLVRQTKSRTKAASTQAAPSASASTSKAPSSSSSSSSSSEESEESASSSDSG
jgi:hypothetical protein